jgi:D-alanyl-D-alanine carboxypeptidase (penicillin-binding protein 5/6)
MVYKIIKENHKLDEIVTIDLSVVNTEGAKAGFYAYEKLTVETLLQSILIPSANDGATALAIWHAGSVESFVKLMNKDAYKLGLKSAKFYNPTGLDLWSEEDDKWLSNKMSAYDIAKLVKYLLRDKFFRQTIQQPVFEGSSIDGEFFHTKKSTNKLLENKLFKGVKTGYTYLAGQCLVSLASLPQGQEVITIILGSGDRFGETSKLLSWIMNSFIWR